MSFQSTICVLDSHVFFQKSTEIERSEVDVPNTVVDFFKSDVFSGTDNRDVHPIGVPTNAPISAHVADFEAVWVFERTPESAAGLGELPGGAAQGQR